MAHTHKNPNQPPLQTLLLITQRRFFQPPQPAGARTSYPETKIPALPRSATPNNAADAAHLLRNVEQQDAMHTHKP